MWGARSALVAVPLQVQLGVGIATVRLHACFGIRAVPLRQDRAYGHGVLADAFLILEFG